MHRLQSIGLVSSGKRGRFGSHVRQRDVGWAHARASGYWVPICSRSTNSWIRRPTGFPTTTTSSTNSPTICRCNTRFSARITAGEIPWWDPYTYGGRPLLADAHVNGTDPVRLFCYAVLPFELAYNWNYLLRGILTGLGMFLLLRSLRVGPTFPGCWRSPISMPDGSHCIGGIRGFRGRSSIFRICGWSGWDRRGCACGRRCGLGGLLCGLVFYAGNLQSHTYLPIFALSFLAATLVKVPGRLPRAFVITALSGLLGALLAAPVLANQIEFFLQSARVIESGGACSWHHRLLAIPLTLGSYYPWMFGTFKTLDIGHLTQMNGMGFQWFCGAGGWALAAWGAWALRREKGDSGMAVCQACALLAIYLGLSPPPWQPISTAVVRHLPGWG